MNGALCRDCCQMSTSTALTAGDFHERRCPGCGSARVIAHVELNALPIAHIDCDAFYASVEKRDNPGLADKPLIIGHDGGRGVVTTACYIARQYGIRSAMPMFKALQACPHATVITPDMDKYKEASTKLRQIFRAATPVIEPISLDEAYLDLTDGVRSDLRPVPVLLADAAQRIESQIGITVSIGLSANKFLAKLASDLNKPRGFSLIGKMEAKAFLAPLPVRKINGVGEVTARRMEAFGLRTIGDLQSLPQMQLTSLFGKFGRQLANYAQGLDERKVSSARKSKSVSVETTFARDTAAPAELQDAARRLCERLSQRLKRADLAGGSLVLKLKTHDFNLLTRTVQLGRPTQRTRLLYDAAHALIDKEADGRRFRLIGVGVGELVPAAQADPPELFDL